MIGRIKTRWLRRLVMIPVLAVLVPLTPLLAITNGVLDIFDALWPDIKDCWKR